MDNPSRLAPGQEVEPHQWRSSPFWAPSPYPPGDSPYKMKGLVYRQTLADVPAYIRSRLIDTTEDARMRLFLEQPFLASSMVDVLPMPYLAERIASLLGQTPSLYAAERAKAQAQSQLSGVYRFLLKLATPATAGRFVSRATQSYFNFGRVDVSGPSAGPLAIVRTGVPFVCIKWYATVSSAFLEAGLEAAGARRARAKVTSVVVEGRDRQGLTLVTLHYDLSWLSG